MNDRQRKLLMDAVFALNTVKLSDPILQSKADQLADELSEFLKQEINEPVEAPF